MSCKKWFFRFGYCVCAPVLVLLLGGVEQAAGDLTVRVVPQQTNDIVYDPVSDLIYASVPSSAGFPSGNGIIPINPHTGAVGTSVFAGSEPKQLALADNGSVLYVAIGTTNRVERYYPATQTMGTGFEIGPVNYRVEDMEVAPGRADVLAIARRHTSGSPYNQGAAIYVDGAMLPDVTGMASCNIITFSDSANTLYGHNSGISPHTTLLTLDVDLSPTGGATITKSTGGVFGLWQGDIQFDGGRVYSTRGQVIDPVNHVSLGAYSVPWNAGAFVPDSAHGLTFYQYDGKIKIFHQPTYLLMGEIDVPGFSGNGADLIRWGSQGLAFRTGDKVYIIESSAVPEPSTLALLCIGGVGLAIYACRRRRQ